MLADQSLTQMYFGIFFDIIFWILIIQMVVVGLLIVPVPSNKFRGAILFSIDYIWNSSVYLRHFCVVLSAILAIICAASIHAMLSLEKMVDKKYEAKYFCSLMEAERNVYMTAFSLFLSVMGIRLMEVSRQLHDARKEIKRSKENDTEKESKKTK